MPANIILIGLSGSGKTSTGRVLAEQLGWTFRDSDLLIAAQTGRSVAALFADQGEAAFRDLEADMIAQLCDGAFQVITTGGGAVLREENRMAMLDGNLLIRLDASPEIAIERMQSATTEQRPLLAGTDPLANIRAMRQAREPYYQIAPFTVQTDALTPNQTAQTILDAAAASGMDVTKLGRIILLAQAHTRLVQAGRGADPNLRLPDRFDLREILIHVTAWENEVLQRLPAMVRGEPSPQYTLEAFNGAALAARATADLEQAWDEFEQIHNELMTQLLDIPEAVFPNRTFALRGWLGILINHSQKHARALETRTA